METKAITPFNFKGNDVTVIEDSQGNPWWVASEVCAILGYANPWDAIARHCKRSQKMTLGIHEVGGGGRDIRTIIPEPDLYRLISHSKLPAAEQFEEWVFEEVLPSIRKTGGYIHGADQMSEKEILAAAFQIAERTIDEQKRKIEADRPKVESFHKLMDTDGLFNITKTAKVLGVGRNAGFDTGSSLR